LIIFQEDAVRKRPWFVAMLLPAMFASFSLLPGFAQSESPAAAVRAALDPAGPPQGGSQGSVAGKIGVQAKVSTLGVGGEVAIEVARRVNVRGGFSLFNFTHSFDKDGITYDGTLKFRSATANLDLYLLGPFHVSPGVLLYNGFSVAATASAPAGKTFTLGGTTYESGAASPLGGSLAIAPRKAAPEVLIGFGNLVPRSGRHFTANLDLGVVFQGSPNAALTLTGLACAPPNTSGASCVNAATDPTVQSNVIAQQNKLNNDLKAFKYYPVLSFGIGWRF
jgi:hypothetical protein